MKLSDILPKIAARIAELDTSERQVSIAATGSPDTIRNWRRNFEAGKDAGATIGKLTAVAEALNMQPSELIGEDDPQPMPQDSYGFSEPKAASFTFQEQHVPELDSTPGLRRIFGQQGRTLGEFRLSDSIPAFQLVAGDAVIADIAGRPEPGQLCIVTRNPGTDDSYTIIARFFGEWLDLGQPGLKTSPVRADAHDIEVRSPIIGVLRGLPPPAKGKP
jgi:hypothetical protein